MGWRSLLATLIAGALAGGAVWLAVMGDGYVAMLTREIRQGGWGEVAQVMSVLRWPMVAVAGMLALTLLCPLVDGLLKRLAGRR
ncbi:MAG: hypothetical protein AAF899_18000 [Pseudomonadota bacterium]